jgi:hypothetical protein
MIRTVDGCRYVTPFREGGSVPALMEGSDLGMYGVKVGQAAQGPKALVAELRRCGSASGTALRMRRRTDRLTGR